MKIIHSKSDGSKQTNGNLFLVHLVNQPLVVLCHYRAFQLQRVRQLATLHAERFGQEREALHLLIMGKLLLQGIDTGTEQRLYLGMLQ